MQIRASLLLALVLVVTASAAAGAQEDPLRSTTVAPLVRVSTGVWGAGVYVIDSTEIAESTAPTFSELLQARRPGLRVLRSGGLARDGALVMLRGPTSLIGPSTPIVIVDGIRVDSRQFDQPLALGSAAPSRLDDLLPEDISQILVLSGAAAALYGDGSANGVILVTTKSGGKGPLRLSGRVAWSATQDNGDYPANYQRVGTSPTTGQPVADCSLQRVAAGLCTPTALHSWNPLEQASPFGTGNSALGRLALGGTTLGTSILASVTGNVREGVLPRDATDRIGLRARVVRSLPGHFTVVASGGSLREHGRAAVEGNLGLASNVIANGLLGSAQDDANRGYAVGFPSVADSTFPAARVRHASGGVSLYWQPGRWLAASVMTGRDLVTERWHEDHIGLDASTTASDRRLNSRNDMRTSSAMVSSAYRLGYAVIASTTAQLERDVLQRETLDSIGAPPLLDISGSEFRMRSTDLWLTEAMHLPRAIDLTASMERVTSGIVGATGGKEWFPSANISWSPFVEAHGVSDVRLRAAYAEVPGSSMALLSLLGIVAPPFGPPPPPPKMERTKDIEVGAEATFGHRTTVSVTAFRDRSTRLWYTVAGTVAQGGVMTNSGVEAMIHTPLLNRAPIHWSGALSLALLRNRVSGFTGPPVNGSLRNPFSSGYAFGGAWTQSYTYADVNGDGIIATNEVQLGAPTYAGPALPTLESAFATELKLPRYIVLSAQLDYRHGNHAVDHTGRLRCSFRICRETQDPTAPLDRQAAAIANQISTFSTTGFVDDASFMRIREIAVHWTIPEAGTNFLGVAGELTFAARNLATWTGYHGLDPEISYLPPDILPRQEFLTMPLPRELVVRLDVRP